MIDRINTLIKTNKQVCAFFIDQFYKHTPAQTYVHARLSKETTKKFLVGYAPRTGFVQWADKNNINESALRELGLVNTDDEGYVNSAFYDRIMLPVIHGGCIVGFGGRCLSKNMIPKYKNSRASALYAKSDVLFGLYHTRENIVRKGFAILVEGYFDVMGMYDCGVKVCVTPCGTALTKQQALLLRRYTDKVFVLMDPDEAGKKAAKAVAKALGPIYAGTMHLPAGLDPDEFVRKNGKEALKDLKLTK